jgi:hypothetical protein|tara:strand:+ start:584 stop:2596 length:2013 start_codon:yes stop_codon:yes gene_type:complete
MKDTIISIDLATETAPQIGEVRGRDYIEYGAENWRNLYPQFLIDLYYNSSTNAAIINATSEMIAGEDLVIDDENERDLDAIVRLKKFMANANSNETLHEVVKKAAFDFKLQGAFALNIVWNQDRTEIAEIYHIGVEKIRCEKANEMGRVTGYYVSADWSNRRANKPYRVPAFNPKDRTSANQILYTGLYSPGMAAYYTPDYLAANNWSLIDQKVAEFHLHNINSGFTGSFLLNFSNGIPSHEERLQLERSITEKFTGASNSGKFVLTFSDDKTRTPEINAITPSDLDKQFLALQELLVQNILTGHRVTSPTLMGIRSSSGLGNNADEINSAANFYLNTVVKPFQEHIIMVLRKLFTVNNMDMPISFVQLKPITTRFTNQDLMAVMTQDEIREELGLPPLKEEVVVKDEFSKVGMIDGKPVFNTKEEAIAQSETLGCSGYHEHEHEGKKVYMACETHNELMDLGKTELEKFIEEFGEDEPEGYLLLDQEIVEDENEGFDFENELNDKYEFATVPKADRDGKSEQDGWSNKVSKFFKVRYKYDRDSALTNKSGTRREFCRKMIGANRLYKKEDLIALDKKRVNPGFGPKGAATYSIWLWKGGPQCFHRFIRKIYVMELEDAWKEKDITLYGKLISTAKARSQGFYPEANDKKVAEAPRTMPNRGYLPGNKKR